jgi:hypothetical protein
MMRAPFGFVFPVLAVGAALFAIATQTHYTIALGAGVVAVVAAALTIWDAAGRSPKALAPPTRPLEPETVGVRSWLERGRLGRMEIIHLLDRLDRGADRPDLPIRRVEEIALLADLPEEQFREYLTARIETIEGEG